MSSERCIGVKINTSSQMNWLRKFSSLYAYSDHNLRTWSIKNRNLAQDTGKHQYEYVNIYLIMNTKFSVVNSCDWSRRKSCKQRLRIAVYRNRIQKKRNPAAIGLFNNKSQVGRWKAYILLPSNVIYAYPFQYC